MPLASEQETDSWIVTPSCTGQRIDKLLAEHYPFHSRTYFQKLIEDGFVLCNGQPVKKRIILEPDDEIEVCFQLPAEHTLEPESIPLDILFEDEHLIAIHKPAGMVVHPAPGHWNGTFVNALLGHCQHLAPSQDPLRPGIVHRLDRDTSGVLLAAKTTAAHQKLVQMFSHRQIEKYYLAICVGRPSDGIINAPIGRHSFHRKKMAVVSNGREAISQVRTLAFDDSLSFVLIQPKTGRTHQIRVHLHHIRHPVLGDLVYGNEKINRSLKIERHLLHAHQLIFTHPVTGRSLHLTASIPADFKKWVSHISVETGSCSFEGAALL
jgi:23S rRNA pseudouridine1911/1915/1917 synthase